MRINAKEHLFLFLVTLVVGAGIFFRLYNLSWGSPYFFHPDERNIASSISQLSYPGQMNPHFFAYGSLPIYSIYFIGVSVNFINNTFYHSNIPVYAVSFNDAIIIGRLFSAILSSLLLYVIFLTSKEVAGTKAGLISTLFATFSIGFIQYAHFATFEMWLSFFTLITSYLLIRYVSTRKKMYLTSSIFTAGFLTSIKISSVIFIPLALLIFITCEFYYLRKSKKINFTSIERLVLISFLFLGASLFSIFLTSPYFWFDNQGFSSAIQYESSVALGTLKVFYTQIFLTTTPLYYPMEKVFPFILNPFVALLGFFSIFYAVFRTIQKKDAKQLILLLFFLVAFTSQLFLFVKWIRYYIPTLAFIYIFTGSYINFLIIKQGYYKKLGIFLILLSTFMSILFAGSYFKTVLLGKDSRIEASNWASSNIPHNSKIISEVYDLGIVPFNSSFSSITLFNFYDLDVNPLKSGELKELTSLSNYFIIPSQRIIADRIQQPSIFPKSHNFYSQLENGKLGFKKIYQTPCDIFCELLYLGDPLNRYEQTANIFDRPTVIIFKKM